MKNIILIGLPGCGKSTIGKLLSEVLHKPFIEFDTMIEKNYTAKIGQTLTCREIYAQKGKAFFRQLERETLEGLMQKNITNSILSSPGGIVETPENLETLKKLGWIIYLSANILDLFPRITRHGIPAYLDANNPFASFEKLVQMRSPLYISIADEVVVTHTKTPQEIVSIIVELCSKNQK